MLQTSRKNKNCTFNDIAKNYQDVAGEVFSK